MQQNRIWLPYLSHCPSREKQRKPLLKHKRDAIPTPNGYGFDLHIILFVGIDYTITAFNSHKEKLLQKKVLFNHLHISLYKHI
nr:hypothetical protein Itr_chr14CG14180 [Ipomoea trifida]